MFPGPGVLTPFAPTSASAGRGAAPDRGAPQLGLRQPEHRPHPRRLHAGKPQPFRVARAACARNETRAARKSDTHQVPQLGALLPACLGAGSPTKIDYGKKGALIPTFLLEDLAKAVDGRRRKREGKRSRRKPEKVSQGRVDTHARGSPGFVSSFVGGRVLPSFCLGG